MGSRARSVALVALAAVAALVLTGGCASRGPAARVGPGPAPWLPPASPELAWAVVHEAYGLLGSPYRAGGADPSGFDCSGFVAYVFGRTGIGLPRTVAEMATTGLALPQGPIAAGDLVFFATMSSQPSHVAIALGDGRFVHAPSARGVVRIERLDSPYWARRYLGARRVLPATGWGAAPAVQPRP
jgi:hypothetical protein